jgi:hypothetical protein
MRRGSWTKKYKTAKGKAYREGVPQHMSGACDNHKGCPICEGNRTHKFWNKKPLEVEDE